MESLLAISSDQCIKSSNTQWNTLLNSTMQKHPGIIQSTIPTKPTDQHIQPISRHMWTKHAMIMDQLGSMPKLVSSSRQRVLPCPATSSGSPAAFSRRRRRRRQITELGFVDGMGNGRKRMRPTRRRLTEEADTSRTFASLYTYGADSGPHKVRA
jgi:hypothetical protein